MTAALQTCRPHTAVVPVAAPTALRRALTGAGPTRWRVLSRRRRSVLVRPEHDRPDLPPVVSVVEPDGVATAQSLRVPTGGLPTADMLVVAADPADRTDHPDVTHRVGRWWDSSIPRIDPVHPDVLPTVPPSSALTAPQRDRVAAAATADSPVEAADLLSALIGLGVGSTPAGDDAVAGVLVGWYARGLGDRARTVAHLLGDLGRRTTALSTALLRLTADGHTCAEVRTLLLALDGRSAPHPAAVDRALARVLALGATSGADLLVGLLPTLGPHSVPPTDRT